jgi:hypothetical protein
VDILLVLVVAVVAMCEPLVFPQPRAWPTALVGQLVALVLDSFSEQDLLAVIHVVVLVVLPKTIKIILGLRCPDVHGANVRLWTDLRAND